MDDDGGAWTGPRVPTADIVGAVAAIAGGVLWTVKSGSILVAGIQPPLTFEVAPALFGTATVALTLRGPRTDRRIRWALRIGVAATVVGIAAVALGATGPEVFAGAALGFAMLGVLAGLVLVGLTQRSPGRPTASPGGLALLLGVAVVPLNLAGGALAVIDERLLEVPLLVVALAWVLLGCVLLRDRGHPSRK